MRVTWMCGTQLVCRKPGVLMAVGCCHPTWWQRLLGETDFCMADHILFNVPREAFMDIGLCDIAKEVIAALPSYRELEMRDQIRHPEATPCNCGRLESDEILKHISWALDPHSDSTVTDQQS